VNTRQPEAVPEFRVVWPLENLVSITTETRRRTAVVLCVTNADETERCLIANGLAVILAQAGVELFALVGTESERVHDALDWVLEEADAEEVVTSWHHEYDAEDVAALVAGMSRASGLNRIVAVLDESSLSGANLRDAMLKAARRDL